MKIPTASRACRTRIAQAQEALASLGRPRLEQLHAAASRELVERGNPRLAAALADLARAPVDIDTFIDSPDFLGKRDAVWPALRADLRAMNPDVLAGAPPVTEVYLGGATGIGKSTVARVNLLYQLYLLTCFRDPRRVLGLDAETRIIFVLQSVAPEVTERVLYQPLRQAFEAMPYANRHLSWNRRRGSTLELDCGIHVVPLNASIEGVLGQAVIGGILDEVNFMRIVGASRRVAGPRGQGGRHDQAEELYRELHQRRASRFGSEGLQFGALVLCSSAHYPNDFLHRRIQEARALDLPGVLWRQHRRYDVAPRERYSGDTFRLLVGDNRQRTRVLEPDESVPPDARIEEVPVEHRNAFLQAPEHALRTIVGIPSEQLRPFLDPATVAAAFERGMARGLEAWVDRPETRLGRDPWPRWQPEAIARDAPGPRFLHVDLALTRDACGLAVVRVDGFTGADGTAPRPRFLVEAAVALRPAPDHELVMAELRRWIFELIHQHGVELRTVSFDSYQSRDFQQLLRRLQMRTLELSVDRDPAPYEHLRDCLHEERLDLCEAPLLQRELLQLERDPHSGRINHPPRGSKDIADAVCGALWAAVQSRPVRNGPPRGRPEGRRTFRS